MKDFKARISKAIENTDLCYDSLHAPIDLHVENRVTDLLCIPITRLYIVSRQYREIGSIS